MARPIATRWLWPPESWCGRRARRWPICRISAARGDAARRSRAWAGAGSPGRSAGSARRSCAGRARRTGRPSPCRGPPGSRWSQRAPSMMDLAGGDLLEAGDHAEQRGLAAAGGADEDGEGAVVDGEVDAVDDLEPPGSSCGRALSSMLGQARSGLRGAGRQAVAGRRARAGSRRASAAGVAAVDGDPPASRAASADREILRAARLRRRLRRERCRRRCRRTRRGGSRPARLGAKARRPATKSAWRPEKALTSCQADIERA